MANKFKESGLVPKNNPKAPPKRADEIKKVPLDDLPIKDGPTKVVDVNGHIITLPDLEAAKQYIGHSGGKIAV